MTETKREPRCHEKPVNRPMRPHRSCSVNAPTPRPDLSLRAVVRHQSLKVGTTRVPVAGSVNTEHPGRAREHVGNARYGRGTCPDSASRVCRPRSRKIRRRSLDPGPGRTARAERSQISRGSKTCVGVDHPGRRQRTPPGVGLPKASFRSRLAAPRRVDRLSPLC